MFRSHTCGELRISDVNKQVTLAGWVQRSRKMGGMTFIDLRDRYGITQLVFNEEVDAALCENANRLGREFVIQITGTVNERFSKNANIPTGDIEIIVSELNVLNAALTRIITGAGIVVSLVSFIGVIWAIVCAAMGSSVAGWASTVCIVCFMSGVQLVCLGVIGEYIGKIYMETKARPRYIISERTWAPYERKYHG